MAPTTTTHTDRLREVAVALRLELKRASGNIDRSRLAVLRATITIDEIDPADWLCGVTARPRIFWAGRDDSRSTGAAGVAHRIKSTGKVKVGAVVDDMRTRLATSSDDSIRYYGGFRFDMGLETPADQWSEFGSAQFVLPRVEISTDDNRTTVAAHVVFPQDCHHLDHALEEIESLLTDTGGNIAELPGEWLRVDSPTEAGWENLLTSAMTVFSETDFRKIVLARKATLTADGQDFDSIAVLNRLRQATSHCYHACFEFGQTAFISSSPERLYFRNQNVLETEAIAGTRPRGQNQETDKHFKSELQHSDKELREHDYVAMGIEQCLRPLSESLTISNREVLQLPRMQHLCRRFKALLKNGISDTDLLRALHPTAAVGTFPTRDAAKLLAVFEPIDRGWYAGPVGWVGRDAAEFAVAIRSGLVHGEKLMLYAGAGVLEGSTPMAEWNEIEIKLGNFIKALK